MGLRFAFGGRNEVFTRERKLFTCSVYTIMTQNVTASQKNTELFAVKGTHVMECNLASVEMGDQLATLIRAQAEKDYSPRFVP